MAYGSLSHNHFLLVLLCWLNGAIWNLDDEDRKCLSNVLDADGRSDLKAAVAVENFVELNATVQGRHSMEVQRWKIFVEELWACSLILHRSGGGTADAARSCGELMGRYV